MNFQATFLPTVGKHAALTMVAIAPATGAAAEVPGNSSNPEAGVGFMGGLRINRCDDGSECSPTHTLRGWWNLHLACPEKAGGGGAVCYTLPGAVERNPRLPWLCVGWSATAMPYSVIRLSSAQTQG